MIKKGYFIKVQLLVAGLLFSDSTFALRQDLITQPCFEKLTILTCPIGNGNPNVIGGHFAVTRSLLAGLKKLNVNFNYNPRSINDVGDVVYVVCDANAVKQCIPLRKIGRIKKLLAGPNLMVRSNEFNNILASPEIDTYIVNSDWTVQAYIDDQPSLKDRIQIWYAGIDENYWQPIPIDKSATKKVIVYWKNETEQFCVQIEDMLKKNGWSPIRLRYGAHKQQDFKNALLNAAFCVFISRSESQGIALAESWAMNVPTIVWDPQEPCMIEGKACWPHSAAPYLNNAAGISWRNLEEFQEILKRLPQMLLMFNPRAWILRNMTDEISVQVLLQVINSEPNAKIRTIID